MKKDLNDYKALKAYLEKNECFKLIGDKITCKICVKTYSYVPREGVAPLKQHLKSKLHCRNLKVNTMQTELNIKTIPNPNTANDFDVELIKTFCSANIPLSKLENQDLINFLKKYTGIDVKSESWYRKILLEKLYKNEMQSMLSNITEKDIYVMFDETTDDNGRYILNILIGECSAIKRTKAVLVETVELERTNAVNINRAIINMLTRIYNGNIQYNKIKLLLSDQAPYAIKVGSMLKTLIPEIKHVTCLCHLLHRVCEEIRKHCPTVNSLISTLKRLLVKNKSNQHIFEDTTKKKLPKFPVITRWGMWIEFGHYVAENYAIIKNFANTLMIESDELKQFFSENNEIDLINQLKLVSSHIYIPKAIKKLEGTNLSTEEQIQILMNVKTKLKDARLIDKLQQSSHKNPDLSFFINFCSVKSPKSNINFSFVPLTTVDAERSFSLLKGVLSERRRNLTPISLGLLLGLYFNLKK